VVTIEEAIKESKIAIMEGLRDLIRDGKEIPAPTPITKIAHIAQDQIIVFVPIYKDEIYD